MHTALTLGLVQGVAEDVDGGGHLQALEEDLLLALQADVVRPANEPGQVLLGLPPNKQTKQTKQQEGTQTEGSDQNATKQSDNPHCLPQYVDALNPA